MTDINSNSAESYTPSKAAPSGAMAFAPRNEGLAFMTALAAALRQGKSPPDRFIKTTVQKPALTNKNMEPKNEVTPIAAESTPSE